jgi:thiol-disulfide isomerase/thioredoxin
MNTSRRQFNRWITVTLAAVWTGLIALAGTPKTGEAFPDLAKANLEGKLPDLAGKIVVVDFWASWCSPCKKALPVLAELSKEYGPKGVVFVAVSLDEDKADMDAFLKKNPLPFTVVRDPKGKLAESLNIQGIPVSFVIAPDGKVAAAHNGFEGDKTRAKYVAQLDQLLKK